MLTSDKLILVEMMKSGTMPIKRFLGDVVGGETSGKTNIYAAELSEKGVPVVGVVCNPLTWYLTEWLHGCEGKGDLRKRLIDEKRWHLALARKSKQPGKDKDKPDPKAIPPHWGVEHAKNFWYAEAKTPEAFREWLRAVIITRGMRFLVDRGYQVSPVSNLGGLMTYQYVVRFLKDGENLDKSMDSLDKLKAYNDENAITTHFVRVEHAADDLVKIMQDLQIPLSDEQREAAAAIKKRGSEARAVREYYDADSLQLVATREAFINDLFGYSAQGKGGGGKGKGGGKKKDKPQAAEPAAGAKPSKEEKEQKRQQRAERQAAKAPGDKAAPAKAAVPAGEKKKPKAAKQPAAEGAPAAEKAPKLKRVKNRAPDEDVIESD